MYSLGECDFTLDIWVCTKKHDLGSFNVFLEIIGVVVIEQLFLKVCFPRKSETSIHIRAYIIQLSNYFQINMNMYIEHTEVPTLALNEL